jgi:hypothetical protein
MESHLIALQPGYFKHLYRLSKETFLELVTLIYPRLVRKKSRGPGKAGSIDPRVMLAITLRFLAVATCLDLAWPYCIALPTVYSVIDETLEALDDSLLNIKFPYTEDECRAASEGFQRLRNSPFYGVIGAIDGIAIAIRAPSPSGCPNPRSFSTGRASSRSMLRLLWEPTILCCTNRQNTQAQRTTVLLSSPPRCSTCCRSLPETLAPFQRLLCCLQTTSTATAPAAVGSSRPTAGG